MIIDKRQKVQDNTLVLTCADLFHSFLQQPQHILYRTACNCIASNFDNAMKHFKDVVDEKECKEFLVVGHVSCQALRNIINQVLFKQSTSLLPLRLGSLLNSIVTASPAINVEEAIVRVAYENIRLEIEAFRNYFLSHGQNDIKVSGAIFTEDETLLPVESDLVIF